MTPMFLVWCGVVILLSAGFLHIYFILNEAWGHTCEAMKKSDGSRLDC